MQKPKTTRTLGPLHFEDLEPHRFEALVRNLLYDFRNWQSVESTGEGGSDDGFDVRAWEKVGEVKNESEAEEDKQSEEGVHPMEGNLWMIQCKREKEIGPKRILEILETIDPKAPPYGYILAASVTFSKQSYDVFRQKLRKKGVTEFYLWGKADLESMLNLPKNDRILFTFFGLSLVTQRRSRSAELKFSINNKNKLFRILSDLQNNDFRESILVRDLNDNNYPYKGEYEDFEKKPRWEEFIAFRYHPLGLWVHARERYAYIDKEKKEYDFIPKIDLLYRQSDVRHVSNPEDDKRKEFAKDYWEHLPLKNQATLKKDGFILYDDILVIDDKGDVIFQFPHIYVDYKKYSSPFYGGRSLLGRDKNGEDWINVVDENYKKVDIFPKEFPEPKFGKIYKDKFIELDELTIRAICYGNQRTGMIFDSDGKYSFLDVRDVIAVKKPPKGYCGETQDNFYLEVTYKYSTSVGQFLKENKGFCKENIEKQVGRQVNNKDTITIFEVREIYDWQLEKK